MLDADNPSDREDVYHRGTLAERIAHILAKPLSKQSLVVALEGPWGSGKSWLIEKSVEHLKSQGSTVIQFNPWLIGEESDLILDFLIQMALEIRPIETAVISAIDSSKSASRTLIKYARALSYGRYLKYAPIPVAKEIGEWIDDHADQINQKLDTVDEALKSEKRAPSLSEARAAARDAISHMEGRLIVVIDDIDRLRPREIRAIMQLVKSVLDFPNTSFLLAYDPEQVACALSENGNRNTGMRYLEKIIQLSINVPPLDRQLILHSIQERFDQIIKHVNHELRPYEQELKSEALKLVASLCDTPREVVRWTNRFAWSLSALQDSVNAADLCAIEILFLKLPKDKWEILIQFIDSTDLIFDQDDYSIVKKYPSKVTKDEMLAKFPAPREWEALTVIFPSLISNYADRNSLRNRRLHHRHIWNHYIRISTGISSITGADVAKLMKDPYLFKNKIDQLCQPDTYSEAIGYFSDVVSYINIDDITSDSIFIDIFLNFIKFSHNNEYSATKQHTLFSLHEFSSNMLFSYINRKENDGALKISENLPPLIASIALEIVLKSGLLENTGQTLDVIKKIRELIISRLNRALSKEIPVHPRHYVGIIHSIARLTSPSEAANKLADLIKTNEGLLSTTEGVFDYHGLGYPPLINLIKEPSQFIQRIELLQEPRLKTYLECLHSITSEQLEEMKSKLQSNQPTE